MQAVFFGDYMLWYRRWTDRQNSIQLHKVGFWGIAVFDALCDISAERDFGGSIPKEYVEVSFLIRQMRLKKDDLRGGPDDDFRTEIVTQALFHLKQVGLIVENECFILIDGWQRRQPKVPKKSTERVRKHRKLLKKTLKNTEKNETEMKHDETRFTMFPIVSETHETHIEKEKEREKERESKSEKKEKKLVAKATGEKSAHKSLTDKLSEAYEQARGSKYLHQKGKDGVAVRDLLSIATEEEILARWRKGLISAGWHQVSTFAQLRQKWNDLAQPLPVNQQSTTPKPKPKSTAEMLEESVKNAPTFRPLKERNPELWAKNEKWKAHQEEVERQREEKRREFEKVQLEKLRKYEQEKLANGDLEWEDALAQGEK